MATIYSKTGADDALDAALSAAKGQPNGVAALDAEGLIPLTQLPDGIGGTTLTPDPDNPGLYLIDAGTTADRLISVGDDLTLPPSVKVPSAQVTGLAAALAGKATAAQGERADAAVVQQVTLTAPLAYTLPAGIPVGVVHRVVFTQNGTGGHAVTYGGSPVAVDLTPGASTMVEAWPVDTGWMLVRRSGVAGVAVHVSATPPESPTIDGQPVLWLRELANYIPEVTITDATLVYLNASVTFVGYDPDDDPLVFTVTWGDGSTTTDAMSPALHTYSAAGSKVITVTASDGRATASASVIVYASAAPLVVYASDSFTYPDGTVLAGWVSDTVKEASLTTEVGGLTWQPGDQSTGLPMASNAATVYGGRLAGATVTDSTRSARLDLPAASARMIADYFLPQPTDASSRITFWFACSPTTTRTQSSTSVCVRITGDRLLKVWSQSNNTLTQIGDQVTVPYAGHIEAAYNATTGAILVLIDGAEVGTWTYTGTAYASVGIEQRRAGWLDNFTVAAL